MIMLIMIVMIALNKIVITIMTATVMCLQMGIATIANSWPNSSFIDQLLPCFVPKYTVEFQAQNLNS